MKKINPFKHLPTLAALAAVIGMGVSTACSQVVLTPMWQISATNGAPYTYINVDSTQRGIGYNPTTNHIYVASRTGSPQVYIIDAFTGAHVGQLDVTGISGGGGGAINLVDVADDGSIYVCNLATSAGTFRLYRYTNENSAPLLVYLGDPGLGDTNAPVSNSKRFGDNMTVRGSGTNVQVLVNSRGGRAAGLLYTVDDSMQVFTNQVIHLDAPNNTTGLGIAFGTNNTFWAKAGSQNLRKFEITNPSDIYNPAVPLSATTIVNVSINPATTSGLATLSDSNLLAILNFGNHNVQLHSTVGGSTNLQDVKSQPLPTTANGNGTGVPEFGTLTGTNYLWVLDSNNGLAAYTVSPVAAPVVGANPGNVAILNGGFGGISATANGTSPLTYYWRRIDTNALTTNIVATIVGSGALSFTNVTPANAGLYDVIVSNSIGTATSAVAVVTISPSVLTTVGAKLWQLLPGSRSYLTATDAQRSMTFNPVSGRVLVANRAGGLSINVLDAATGNNITNLDLTGVLDQPNALVGFGINTIGAAEDGAIYAANLTTGGDGYTIYRWADDQPTTIPTVAYGPGNPISERIGDTLSVQGSGVNTKILASSRNGTKVAVFNTSDGLNFTPNTVDVSLAPTPAPAGFAGLGLTAGDGDSFWATSNGGQSLRKVVYDLVNNTNDVQLSLGGQSGFNIVYDAANEFIANNGTTDTPANVRILDVKDKTVAATLIDQEFYGADNANGNGTGALAFDVAGGRIFALDSNNGLIALKYAPRLKANGNVLTWTGPGVLQSATTVTGTYNDIVGSTSPFTTNTTGNVFFKVRR